MKGILWIIVSAVLKKNGNNHFWLLFTIPSSTEVYMLRADRSPAFNENNTATCNNGTYQY